MSRDAFSYDPRDDQDASRRSSRPLMRSTPPQAPVSRNTTPNGPSRSEDIQGREEPSTRDSRNDSPRAYYLRDRAYLLRNSEIHSLTEVGKFRVIAAPDLAKHAYGGDRQRMERDVRRLVAQGLLADKTIPISQNKTKFALLTSN